MSRIEGIVEVTRGDFVESAHRVHLAVCDAEGHRLASWGDPAFPALLRSAAKPFQALPLVEDGVAGALGLAEEELAIACASHGGEPEHLRWARSLLAKAGGTEEELACGTTPPMTGAAARALALEGTAPGRIHNNCSGKHAGMIALARFHGWPVEGYHRPEHPVQRRMAAEVARWTGLAPGAVGIAVDGCGVSCFRVPLEAMARGIARFAAEGAKGGAPARIVDAMVRHPFLVAGTARLCTRVMEAGAGRLIAKVGAEGVYVAAATDGSLGIALKVEDGANRASEAALAAILEEVGLLVPGAAGAPWRPAALRNTRGEEVGEVRVRGMPFR